MRVVFTKVINGVDRLIVATTATGDQGQYIINLVKPGNPFWMWTSVPYPVPSIVACDFTNAPVCTTDSVVNNALIAAITTAPEDVLTAI